MSKIPSISPWQYWAFISYSHKDEKTARKIHSILEQVKISDSKNLPPFADPISQTRLRPIFRDQDELAASSSLTKELIEALDASRYLIVLCSLHSAKSRWVAAEIKHFLDQGRSQDVLYIAIGRADIAIERMLPSAVVERTGEPYIVDARSGKESIKKAVYRIAATLLGIRFDELWRRWIRRRRRIAIASLLAISIIVGGLLFQQAQIGTLSNRIGAVDPKQQRQRIAAWISKEIGPAKVLFHQDLNNDSLLDFGYVATHESGRCGSGGCSAGIVLGATTIDQFKEVLDLFGESSIRVGREIINDYSTIQAVNFHVAPQVGNPSNSEEIFGVFSWNDGAYHLSHYEYCAGIVFEYCDPIKVLPTDIELSIMKKASFFVEPDTKAVRVKGVVTVDRVVGKIEGQDWYLVEFWKGQSGFVESKYVVR